MWVINTNYSGVDGSKTKNPENDFVNKLGFTSSTHYQFVHFAHVDRDYLNIWADVKKEWARLESKFDCVYYPHISVGWDNSPRTARSAVGENNTPENFAKGLQMTKDYVDAHPQQAPLITINSWNEWTETSYLLPCDVFGYLNAVKEVFVDSEK